MRIRNTFSGHRESGALAVHEASLETKRPPSKWFVFAIVSMALMMGSIDQTIVATALHKLHQELGAPISWTSWTITGYSLGVVVALPIMGRYADQFGRKRVFLLMVVVFTGASLVCGMAVNIYMLLVARVVQSIGGGAFMPVAIGIVSDRFESDRDRAIGMFTSIFPIGSLIGPVLGGSIIDAWSWRGIFLINVPIGALLLILGRRYLPASPPKETPHADVIGAALLGTTLIAMMYGITVLGGVHASFASPNFLIAESISAVLLVLFYRHARSIEHPIIPIHILKKLSFAKMNYIALVYGGGMIGFSSLVPLYAQDRYHFSSLEAGTVLTARAVGSIAVAGATSFLLRRIGYRWPMLVGFTACAFGIVMLSVGSHWSSDYAWIAVGAMIMGLGGGMASPASNNALLSQAPEEIAALSGLRGMFRQCGGIIAISVITALASRSVDPAATMSHAFFAFGIFLLATTIPIVLTIPQHRGTW